MHAPQSLKIIYKVLKFAAKHKAPLNRSALTYWEEDIPSRMDMRNSSFALLLHASLLGLGVNCSLVSRSCKLGDKCSQQYNHSSDYCVWINPVLPRSWLAGTRGELKDEEYNAHRVVEKFYIIIIMIPTTKCIIYVYYYNLYSFCMCLFLFT